MVGLSTEEEEEEEEDGEIGVLEQFSVCHCSGLFYLL